MVKVRVHITNDGTFLDKDVFVDIKLPEMPRIGERVHINERSMDILHKMAKSTTDIAGNYLEWFFGNSKGIKDVKEKDLPFLCFYDASLVTDVVYKEDCDHVHIQIGKD